MFLKNPVHPPQNASIHLSIQPSIQRDTHQELRDEGGADVFEGLVERGGDARVLGEELVGLPGHVVEGGHQALEMVLMEGGGLVEGWGEWALMK